MKSEHGFKAIKTEQSGRDSCGINKDELIGYLEEQMSDVRNEIGDIILKIGQAKDLLAKSHLRSKQYNPISLLLAEAQLELSMLLNKAASGESKG